MANTANFNSKAILFVAVVFSSLLGMTACGGHSPANSTMDTSNTADPNDSTATPRQLCASNSCGSKTPLLTIPDAENILFTPEGRLFVSGGTNIFEIVETNGSFEAIPLVSGTGNFTGMAQRGSTLYANEFSGSLYAATLDDDPEFEKIYDYVNTSTPNGMAVDSNGSLYTVDGPITSFPPAPQILKIEISADNPFQVSEQTVWLNTGIQFPNGITYNGSSFFITDSNALAEPGSVRRIDINPDGSAGTITTLDTGSGVLDDLSLVDNKILVSGFQNGQITLLDQNGNLEQETTIGTFSTASSVRVGEPPLFGLNDILVTEKGTLNEHSSTVGNVLTVFRAN